MQDMNEKKKETKIPELCLMLDLLYQYDLHQVCPEKGSKTNTILYWEYLMYKKALERDCQVPDYKNQRMW